MNDGYNPYRWPARQASRAHLERAAMVWPAPGATQRQDGTPDGGLAAAVTDASCGPGRPAAAPARHRDPGETTARDIVQTVILTALIAAGVQWTVQSRQIEGSSMEPTLHNGQRLLVNRLAYTNLSEPQRGDIVVFRAWDQDEDYIKRVIGIPGDEIEVAGDRIVVNGNALDEPYIDNHPTRGTPGRVVLGSGEFYVLGDNRDNSSDSRLHGPLPRDRIVGKAWLTYWPFGDVGFVSDFTSYAAPRP